MKTLNTQSSQLNEEFNVLSKRDLFLVKAAIVLFGTVLNICFIDLFF